MSGFYDCIVKTMLWLRMGIPRRRKVTRHDSNAILYPLLGSRPCVFCKQPKLSVSRESIPLSTPLTATGKSRTRRPKMTISLK
jgi:hypothetical protein